MADWVGRNQLVRVRYPPERLHRRRLIILRLYVSGDEAPHPSGEGNRYARPVVPHPTPNDNVPARRLRKEFVIASNPV
jgi:hypothetical protein